MTRRTSAIRAHGDRASPCLEVPGSAERGDREDEPEHRHLPAYGVREGQCWSLSYNRRMAMGKRKRERQPTMWVTTTDLPTAASHAFSKRSDLTIDGFRTV